jgi:beta-xylosidase
MRNLTLYGVVAFFKLSCAAVAGSTCGHISDIDNLIKKISYFDSLSNKEDRIPPDCFDNSLESIGKIAIRRVPPTDSEFRSIVLLNILLRRDDREADLAREVDKIIHLDIKRLRPLFVSYAQQITDKCDKLEFIYNSEYMDCQVEMPFDPGNTSESYKKCEAKHKPTSDILECRK